MTASAAAAPTALESPGECPIINTPEAIVRDLAERVARIEAALATWRLTDEQVRRLVGG
jgi:hypothetical protein